MAMGGHPEAGGKADLNVDRTVVELGESSISTDSRFKIEISGP